MTQTQKRPKKQLEIPGAERVVNEDVENAAEAYRAIRDERAALSKREAMAKAELLVIMRANKLKKYKFTDGENGVEYEAYIDDEPEAKIRKTGEHEEMVGDAVNEGPFDDAPPIATDGLLADAEAAQSNGHANGHANGVATGKRKKGRKAKS